jgi:hypothetical protein
LRAARRQGVRAARCGLLGAETSSTPFALSLSKEA